MTPSDRAGSAPAFARASRIGHGSGFWVVAVAFVIATGFTVVTTPLWTTYQRRDHFDALMVTVAFASYAVGVLVSLFLAGHVSDWMGRRTILIPGLLLEALASALFIVWNTLPGLIVARVITGLGLGMLTATATAHLSELYAHDHPNSDGTRPDIVATAANIGGFAVGVLAASALVQLAPAPVTTPFAVYLVLLLLAALAVLLVPETVRPPAEPRRYRPQRVQVPPAARTHYLAAAAIAFAGFAILGLFTSLAPSFVADQLHQTAPLVGGSVVFATFGSAAVLQIGIRRFPPTSSVLIGVTLEVVGFAALVAGVFTVSFALFLIGGILTGGSAGVLFSSAISAAGQAAPADSRGEALVGIFLAAYAGLGVPVVGLGAATLAISMSTALTWFAVLVTVIGVLGAVVFIQGSARD